MAYEKIKASASVTIVDETEASTLTGSMLVIKGSKNQIYITGQSNPFSPDWTKSNLVIRPFLQATNVTKQDGAGEEYNPDILKIISYFKDKEPINPHAVNPEYLKLTEAEESKLN